MDLTPEDMLALLRRTTDDQGWLEPLLADPDSAALLLATVEVMGRMGQAALHDRDALTIGGASGGQNGTAVLTLLRVGGGTFGTIPKGYPFLDARGVRARAQTDVPVAIGVLTATVPVVTDRQTELVNTFDDAIFQVDPLAAPVLATAAISNLIAPVGDVGNGPATFAVSSSTPIVGGALDWLSVHGSERGLLRQPGELEGDYRARIRNIIDQVTPLAIAQAVQSVVQRGGLPDMLVLEPFDDLASPTLKVPRNLGTFATTSTDAHQFMDDAQAELVDRRTATAYFRVAAQDYVKDAEAGALFFDDGYLDDPSRGYPDAWINMPPVPLAAFQALVQHVSATKGGGVNFDVYARDPSVVHGVGNTSNITFTDVFTLTPPAGSSWLIADVIAGLSSPIPVPASRYTLTFTLRGGATVVFADGHTDARRASALVGKIVTQIVGAVQSNGITSVILVATVWYHEMVGLT